MNAAAIDAYFASPLGEENWRTSGNPLRCSLILSIPLYGNAYFEQLATKPQQFLLRAWEEKKTYATSSIIAKPPSWKPNGQSSPIALARVAPGKFGIVLPQSPAQKLLHYLAQGYQGVISYKQADGITVTISLSPIKFRKMYARYQKCLSQLFTFDFQEVAETILHFPNDDVKLDNENRAKLRKIALYVRADEQIETVRVVGYTDDVGRKGYNNAISEYRAKAVSEYLEQRGIPKEQLSVTWKGELAPFSRNDTETGRASNRRVEIKLIKK